LDVGFFSLKVKERFSGRFGDLFTIIYLTLEGLRLCRKLKCDLIYISHHYKSSNVIPGFLVSRILKKPLVIVFNGMGKESMSKASFRVSFQTLQNHDENLALASYKTFLYFFERIIYRRAEICIAVSQSVAKKLRRHFGIQRLVVIGNGVNISHFKTCSIHRHELYDAIYLGRLTKQKGIDTLLATWKIVKNEKPSAKLIMIGKTVKPESFEIYQSAIEKLGLEKNIIMTGQILDVYHIAKLLNESKVFVLPSRSEGFGLVVMEAMACSCPCVLSDISALREVFEEVAIFVETEDEKKFAKIILDLLDNPEKRRAIGQQSRDYIRKFSWEKVAKKELEVFKFLLDCS